MKIKKIEEFEPIFATLESNREIMKYYETGDNLKINEYSISVCKGDIIKYEEALKNKDLTKKEKEEIKNHIEIHKYLLNETYKRYINELNLVSQ